MTKELMTKKDLSAYLQVPESTVQRFLNNNQIPHHDTLGSPRFYKSEIDAWIKSGVTKKNDVPSEGAQYLYREKPILEYKLSASRVLIGQTPLERLPGFVRDACNLVNEGEKAYLLSQDFKTLKIKNFNDYLRLSCQLGLIDNVRAGRIVHYFPTEFARQIWVDDGIEAVRETIKNCVRDIVKKGKETLPQQRHSIFLLWYILKLKSEGVDLSEDYFNRGGETTFFPMIRMNYAKGLCAFLFDGKTSEEGEYFSAWNKICG